MKPFLYRIADIFYAQFANELYKHTFVFPNKRAGVFFQKYLSEIAGKPIFSPTIITIQELFVELSPYQTADRIALLTELYRCYRQIGNADETFDDFLYWGEMLLNDFDDVDKYLIDARQLFRNVRDLKSLEDDKSYLSASQIEAIRRFWSNFMSGGLSDSKKKFQETWQILFELYTSFRSALETKGWAYEGMTFRYVAEKALAKDDLDLNTQSYVFIGLNALTPAEIALMEHLRNIGKADFYWDYESPMVNDPQNKASFWIKDNLRRFPSRFEIEENDRNVGKPVIELIGVPSAVGQAKYVSQLLSQLIGLNAIPDTDEAIETAVVLPDENLLLPVLYSIPPEIGKINVTMGYAMSHASVASLVDHIANLQHNVRTTRGGETVFYHRFVTAILNHPLVKASSRDEAEKLKNYIVTNNRVVVSLSDIPQQELLQLIFKPMTDWRQIPEYLQLILKTIYTSLTTEKLQIDEPKNDASSIDLEREFVVQYYKAITRLSDTLKIVDSISADVYFRLLKRLAQGISVSFSGEPLSGLQVMGVLETRVLDFENIILLSMNEGVFPVKSSANSFIPYTLRKGFGMPTYEHQDSTYAYHFYRMIGRSKRIFMLYDTRTEGLQTGEVSRYFTQLKFLYGDVFDIRERVATYNVFTSEMPPISIEKRPSVMEKLDRYRAGGDLWLSASHLNNYINCSLQFYFSAVEGFSDEEEVSEKVESDVFGSIFHRVMEQIYRRYENKIVTPDALSAIAKDEEYLNALIEKAFARYYFRDDANVQPLVGENYLVGEIIRSYVKQTLAVDKSFTPFRYIGSEYKFETAYRVNDDLAVQFKGSIDRIDQQEDAYRIIDYKTGKGGTVFSELTTLFDTSRNADMSKILQVFLYSFFYDRQFAGRKLSPALYFMRSIYSENFDPFITVKNDSNKNERVNDASIFFDEFADLLNRCLSEMFNPDIPFKQTNNEQNCQYCSFKTLCGK